MKTFKALDVWVAELDDHVWHGHTEEQRTEFLAWMREAARSNQCASFSVFSIPDPIFPVHHDKKKRVHNEQLLTGSSWRLWCTHHVEIAPEHWQGKDEAGRKKMLTTIRDVLEIKGRTNPGRYVIYVPNGDGTDTLVEQGPLEREAKT